jgi:hypothetical protein
MLREPFTEKQLLEAWVVKSEARLAVPRFVFRVRQRRPACYSLRAFG